MGQTKAEKFVKARGWKKCKGYRVDTDELEEGIRYFPVKDIADVFPVVWFWMKDDSEFASEDIDDIIEQIEDDEGITFEDDKK